MCGRYTSRSTLSDLASVFEVDEVKAEPLPPRWNVAPSQPVYAVALTRPSPDKGPRRALGTFRWGLVPSWAKEPSVGNRMINARAEGIAAKPAYRAAIARRRCLIPADEFYEWQRRAGPGGRPAGKRPWAFRRVDGEPMAFAGIWEVWRPPGDRESEVLRTCAIVTTSANDLVRPVHDRMPVILERAAWEVWLDPATPLEEVRSLLVPAGPEVLTCWPVASTVNSVANDGPALLEPHVPPTGDEGGIAEALQAGLLGAQPVPHPQEQA